MQVTQPHVTAGLKHLTHHVVAIAQMVMKAKRGPVLKGRRFDGLLQVCGPSKPNGNPLWKHWS